MAVYVKLTRAELVKSGACENGLAEFDEHYPEGVFEAEWTVEVMQQAVTGPLKQHVPWAVSRRLLPVVNFSRANLGDANLVRANLYGANLEDANLEDANLVRANLVRANLVRANLYDANLVRANLEDARGLEVKGGEQEAVPQEQDQ